MIGEPLNEPWLACVSEFLRDQKAVDSIANRVQTQVD